MTYLPFTERTLGTAIFPTELFCYCIVLFYGPACGLPLHIKDLASLFALGLI